MRIGILSMQRIYNYGSWLQAYGLKKMLENVSGESVEFVDYRIERPQYCNGFNWISYLKNVTKVGLIDLIASNRVLTKLTHNKQFEHTYRFRKEFWKKLGLTDKPNYSPELDLLVVGSDEVFNCFQENVRVGYSKELFAQNSRAKKTFTYAASFGNTTMEKIKAFGKEKELAQWLSCFERISVRDSNSLAVVKGLLGGEVESNLDPVLMYDFQKEIANCSLTEEQKRQMSKPYMIVYAYPNRLEAQEIETLRQYAADRGLQIYGISGYQSYADEMIYASPLEVLAYFAHAECVVTDTFHGTIFSVINQKPFVTLVRKSVNGSYGNQEKLEDLLNKLHLSQRCTFDPSNMVDILRTPIQFEEANAVIKTERVKTMSYLTEVVNACKD